MVIFFLQKYNLYENKSDTIPLFIYFKSPLVIVPSGVLNKNISVCWSFQSDFDINMDKHSSIIIMKPGASEVLLRQTTPKLVLKLYSAKIDNTGEIIHPAARYAQACPASIRAAYNCHNWIYSLQI